MSIYRMRNLPQVRENDFSDAFGGIGEVLRWKQEQKRKKEEFDRSANMQDRRVDLEDRRASLAEDRARQQHEIGIADRNSKLSQDIAALVREGRHSEAEALAKSSGYVDPKTGQQRAVGFSRGLPPPPGPAAPALDAENPYGPVARKFALREPGSAEPPAPQEEAPSDYAGVMRFMGVQRPQQPPPQAKPRPSLSLPNGGSVEFDPDEGERFKLQRSQEQASRLREKAADPNMPPQVAQDFLREAARLEASLPGASAQHLRNRESQERGIEAREASENKFQLTAEQKMQLARSRMANRGAKKPGDARADMRLDLQTEGAARQLAKDVIAGYGYKESQAQNRKFNGMAEALAQDPNAALDSVTAGSFVKMAQGGTGVISDQDMKAFWERIGGVGERSEQWVMNVLSGKIAPEKRAEVAEAVQWLASNARSKLVEVKDSMEYAFANSPNLSRYGDQFVGTYFAGERDKINQRRRETAGGGKPAAAGVPPALARPEAPAQADVSVDKLQRALDKAKAAKDGPAVADLEARIARANGRR